MTEQRRALGYVQEIYWDGNTQKWHAVPSDNDHYPYMTVDPQAQRGWGTSFPVTLGRVFVDDHIGRDLPVGRIIGETSRTYRLLMTVGDMQELYSDARHYGDGGMGLDFEREYRYLVQAARRVMAALEKQVGMYQGAGFELVVL